MVGWLVDFYGTRSKKEHTAPDTRVALVYYMSISWVKVEAIDEADRWCSIMIGMMKISQHKVSW